MDKIIGQKALPKNTSAFQLYVCIIANQKNDKASMAKSVENYLIKFWPQLWQFTSLRFFDIRRHSEQRKCIQKNPLACAEMSLGATNDNSSVLALLTI